MKRHASVVTLTFAVLLVAAGICALSSRVAGQGPNRPATVNWTLHNLDLAGTRYSPLDQINRFNVKSLTPRWLFQHGVIDGVSNQTTPIVVDGMMWVTDSRGSVYAVDAADGHLVWSYDVTNRLGGGAREGYVFRNRGVVYANGVVYTAGGSFLFALDAKTGTPLQGFGKAGQASPLMDVLSPRYPDVKTAISVGYWFTTAPQFFNNTLYIGSTRSESHIPGGYVMGIDAETGKVKWNFNTIPQDEKEQGWEIAGPTWVGGERNGGGVWETAAIDPELNLLFIPVGNPFGDSTKRAGTNLFTDSVIALTLDTGKLKWYFQETHHDVWDYDSAAPPILFDMQVNGRQRKALAHASKNGYLFILDRETGEPIHPIKEMPVPTAARPGEQPWPTQPIPFTASGKPMEPVCPIVPLDIPPAQLEKAKIVPQYTPMGPDQIFAPGSGGGSNYSPISYSPQTGLLYVAGIDSPSNSGGRGPKGYFTAYDPTTGEMVWRQIFEGYGQAGSVVTAGGVVFVGAGSNIAGYFYAYDARTGQELWKFNTGAGIFSSPSIYMVNGEEFVTVASGGGERGRRGGDLILSFALPKS